MQPASFSSAYSVQDAAHIVPPMSAKGMNLALHDAEAFANAVIRHQTDHDPSLLDSYSSTCLRHVWNYQAFAAWFTDMMHNAGDTAYQGEFRHDEADLVSGQDAREVVGPGRVVEVPVASGEAGAQVVCPVGFVFRNECGLPAARARASAHSRWSTLSPV
ncbi:MAG: p-hydroxybenzoate 3-monooxygenase [Pseudonocardiales bacterium]|nr:p-hydroxybenzoate 3-monooxygenase [Pseudonocardiales bacterium]